MGVFKSRRFNFKTIKSKLGVYPEPQPAVKCLPDWYRKMSHSMLGKGKPRAAVKDGKLTNQGTIKQCVPVLDVLSLGYMLKMPVDVHVTALDNGEYQFHWSAQNVFESWIENHPIEQVNAKYFKDRQNGSFVYKLVYPFSIETPKGYSSLFIPPVYHESKIRILEGFVCTDNYSLVNFPFFITTDEKEFVIEAGTPIAQVIPIKRESWISETQQGKDVEYTDTLNKLTSLVIDRYKRMFHEPCKFR